MRHEEALEHLEVRGLRAVWSQDLGFAPVEPEVIDLCSAAFHRLVQAAGLVQLEGGFECINVYPEWNALAAMELKADFERAGVLPHHADRISPVPRLFIESIQMLSPIEQSEYRERIRTLEREMAVFFDKADLLMTPTVCCTAYSAQGPLPVVIAGKDASRTNAEPFTAIGSICWLPSISIPAGISSDGLPVGLLINGPRHRDEIVLRLARIWEQTQPWSGIAPAFDRESKGA